MKEQIRVLLIEEDLNYYFFVRSILSEDLNSLLFRLESCKGLEESKDALSNERFDVILFDVSTKDEKVKEKFEILQGFAHKIPILILCEHETKSLAKELVEMGAKDYYVKRQIDENTLPLVLMFTVKNKKTEEALKVSEKRFKTIIENSSDIILILDINGTFHYTSNSLNRDFGYSHEQLIGKSFFDFIHEEDKEKTAHSYSKMFQHRDASHSVEFRFKKSDGTWRYLESIGRSILDDSGNSICVINSRDITERIKFEQELKRLSLIDELTELHNRRGFLTLIHQQIKQAMRSKEEIYLLFADVDKLKWINDLYGHNHGDNILKSAAKALKSTFRDVDIIARLGGDEFAVVLVQAKESGMEIIKNRLQERINVCNVTSDLPYKLSMSVGVVCFNPNNPESVEELLARADKLMYEQKKGKKNYKILLGKSEQ